MRKEHTVEERLQAMLSCLDGGQPLGDVAQAYQVEKATLRSWVKKVPGVWVSRTGRSPRPPAGGSDTPEPG